MDLCTGALLGECFQLFSGGWILGGQVLLAGVDKQCQRITREGLNVVLLAEDDVVGETDAAGVAFTDI